MFCTRTGASMLAQKWTCQHGQHSGLRPSWQAWLRPARSCSPGERDDILNGADTGTAGQTNENSVPVPGYAGHSLRGHKKLSSLKRHLRMTSHN